MSAAGFATARAGGKSARAAGWLAAAWRRFQRARLEQALASMTDGQLAQIGVARRDIPARARSLVEG